MIAQQHEARALIAINNFERTEILHHATETLPNNSQIASCHRVWGGSMLGNALHVRFFALTQQPSSPSMPVAFAALVMGACAMGISPVFVRFADVGPFTSAFWRVGLAVPLLLAWVAYEQIYVFELMLIEADARRFITEAIETEKELS